MSKIKVYVVGFEGKNTSAISGFDWYYIKPDADVRFNEMKLEMKHFAKSVLYRGECEVKVSGKVSSPDEQVEEITALVETFLEENDWENSFK